MSAVNATDARKNLLHLMDQVNESHEPVIITGEKTSAVLISESDWQAIAETLYLDAIPGMTRSIRRGLKTPVSELSDNLDW